MWGLIAQLVGGQIASAQQQGDIGEAKKIYAAAVAQYGDALTPYLDAHLKNINLPETAFAAIKGDAGTLAAQKNVLANWENIINSKGADAEFAAQMGAAQRSTQADAASNQAAIQRGMGDRGFGGGSLAMAMAGTNAAEAANREGIMNQQAAAEAQRRQLVAMEQGGAYASNMRNQDYQEAAQRAAAQDAINKYNSVASIDAQKYANQQAQQNFINNMAIKDAKVAALFGQAKGVAQYVGSDAANTRNLANGVGMAANTLANNNTGNGATTSSDGTVIPDGSTDPIQQNVGGTPVYKTPDTTQYGGTPAPSDGTYVTDTGALAGTPNRPINPQTGMVMTTEDEQKNKYADLASWLGAQTNGRG